MVTAGLVCVGIALLSWPTPPRGSARSSIERRRSRRSPIGAAGRSGLVVAGTAVAASVVIAIGWTVIGAIAAALVTTTAAVLVRWSAADRRQRRDLVEMAAALRMLGRELRAGASPEQAVTACLAAIRVDGRRPGTRPPAGSGPVPVPVIPARNEPRSPAMAILDREPPDPRSRSVTVRVLQELVLPGDPSPDQAGRTKRDRGRRGSQVAGRPSQPRPIDDLVVRLVGGWRLAMRCGLPLTGLIEGVTAVAQERVAALDARRAEVAGPRLSGWVLAALPAMGLLLGSGMGVDPVALLLAPDGPGPLLLLVGLTLTCAGMVWSARIVRR